jgi:hypothetical protein
MDSTPLELSDISPPPNARRYTNINDLHGTLQTLHAWAAQHMSMFSEHIPENSEGSRLYAVPQLTFFSGQPLVILYQHFQSVRNIREWYDYLAREYENSWTIITTLRARLQLLQMVIQFLNQLRETSEQREMRQANQTPFGNATVFAIPLNTGSSNDVPPPPKG